MKTTVKIVHSWIEYRSLPDWEWRKDYFSWTTGGYVATNWKRIEEANKSNQEKRKFDKEHHTCLNTSASPVIELAGGGTGHSKSDTRPYLLANIQHFPQSRKGFDEKI